MHNVRHTTSDDVALFTDLYKKEVSVKDIAERTGFSKFTVHKHIHKAGLWRYEARTRHTLNEDAFARLTPDALYWIGFLLTDGCVCGNRVKFALSVKDTGAIEALKSFLQYDGPVEKYKRSVGIRFTSAALSEALRQHGMTERKSLTVVTSGSCSSSVHFWRGAFDGDGGICLRSRYPIISFTSGSLRFAEQYASFLNSRIKGLSAKPVIRKNRKTPLYDVRVSGFGASLVLHLLYDGDITYALPRKLTKLPMVFAYKLLRPKRSRLYAANQ